MEEGVYNEFCQEHQKLTEKVKNKQGELHSCTCNLNINIFNETHITQNRRLLKLMSSYIDEYIELSNQLIKIKHIIEKENEHRHKNEN